MRNITLLLTGCLAAAGAGCGPDRDQTIKTTPQHPAEPPPVVEFTPCTTGLPEEGMWKCDPVFADVNHDGLLDLAAIPRLGDGPRVWLGDGQGNWQDASQGLKTVAPSCGGGLGVHDLNGDGHPDLAVADHCRGAFVYLGDGAGHWEAITQGLSPAEGTADEARTQPALGAEDIAVGDVNGDGHLDLVASSSDEAGINVYLGDGTGRNWSRSSGSLPQTAWANRVALADVNGDGRLDLLAGFSEGPRVWLNDGQGDWTPAWDGMPSPLYQGIYTGLAVGDINEDGRPDVAIANWIDGPEVYLQQENGSWLKTPDVFPDMLGGAIGAALGDIDGDGHLDMVVSGRLGTDPGYVRGVYFLHGDGAGNWDFVSNSGLPTTGLAATTGIALGDVNGDGLLDIAAGSGLIVETTPGRHRPILPARLLVWCASPPKP